MKDKDLLLKDLCSRLPYGVKIQVNDKIETLKSIDMLDEVVGYDSFLASDLKEVKPYLFPLLSMTEEQKKEFDQLLELELKAISDEIDPTQATAFEVDFYNKHHIDWRGLIPKRLAIDATNLDIY